MDRRQQTVPVPHERRQPGTDRRQRAVPVMFERRSSARRSVVDQVLAEAVVFVSRAAEVLTRTALIGDWTQSRALQLLAPEEQAGVGNGGTAAE